MSDNELNTPKPIKGDRAVEMWFERFLSVGREIDQISYQRQHKYGPDNIGMLGVRGLIPRIMDKTMRLKRAIWDEKESYDKDEKVVDAFGDLRNYAQFGIMLIRGAWYNKPAEELAIDQSLQKHICVDLDGTLAEQDELFYTRFHIGKPIQGAKESIDFFKKAGYHIFIYTVRGSEEKDVIKKWLVDNEIMVDDVMCNKPPALVYIDDRAVEFKGDWNVTKLKVVV